MRLGPIAVLRSETLSKLQEKENYLVEENARLSVELGSGSTLHSFMHYPWHATSANQKILTADEDSELSRAAIDRIIKAYAASCKDHQALTGSSMWDGIEERHQNFLSALNDGDSARLHQILANMFQEDIIWGLGKFDNNLVTDMRRVPDKSHVQLRVVDNLVSFAQAAGVLGLVNVEQEGIQSNLEVLKVDLTKVLRDSEKLAELDLTSPEIGGCYGCEIDGSFITIDGLQHSYTVHRLVQLDCKPDYLIAEIGGGFGCLAYHAFRKGFKNFSIFDLPWVNALQAYYLLMTIPQEDVCLYNETSGTVKVLPYWSFDELGEKSVDYVINSDSMPEMSQETCTGYISKIQTVVRNKFLSINQESKASNGNGAFQNSVPETIAKVGGLRRKSRSIYWMRQGFAEEVYVPTT